MNKEERDRMDKLYAENNWNEIDRFNLFEISENLEKIAKALEKIAHPLIKVNSDVKRNK